MLSSDKQFSNLGFEPHLFLRRDTEAELIHWSNLYVQQTSLNPPYLSGSFREVVGLES